jgi:hypothetical protein
MAIKKTNTPASKPDTSVKKKKPVNTGGDEGTDSLANAFDSTPAGAAFAAWPAGKYQVNLTGAELTPHDEKKGQSVQFTYTGHEDEDDAVAGKEMKQWYKIANADGAAGPGIGFLKKDLAILGYEDVTFADLEDTLDRVQSEQPLLNVNVKQNGQYSNVYIEGLVE